ncbi:hypothetical protein KKF61_06035 [Patescibacteria group bacterium]|nr:hypothetical protein [Patescibacteria group bacterium]
MLSPVVSDRQEIVELLQSLMNQGLAYLYKPERYARLRGGGHSFSSPTRVLETPAGEMIQEVVQPVLSPVVISHAQHQSLVRIAKLWPVFLQAQLDIYRLAKTGKLDPLTCRMIKSMCTEKEWELGDTEPGYQAIHPFIRLDAVLDGDRFRVIDINSTRPAGVGDIIAFNTALNGHLIHDGQAYRGQTYPICRAFTDIVRRCVDDWAGDRNLPGESIPIQIALRHGDGDWFNFFNLNFALSGAGLASSLVDPESLCRDEACAVIRSRIKEGDPAYQLLEHGYPDKRCVMSPLYRRFLGNKLWMYLLSIEPTASIFKQALGSDYNLLFEAMPDMGLVEQGRLCLSSGERVRLDELSPKEWVFKDPASSSGRRMLLGFAMSSGKWHDALSMVRDGWVGQRFYRSQEKFLVASENGEPKAQKLYTKYGVYIFGSTLAGIELHAREFPVVHGARNTYFNSVMHKSQ